MKYLLFLAMSISIVGCDNTINENSSTSESEEEIIESSTYIEEEIEGEVVNLDVMNEEIFRFSTINDICNQSGSNTYKMSVPYDDTYLIRSNNISKIEVFNFQKILLSETTSNSMRIDLNKGQTIYVRISSTINNTFNMEVIPLENMVELPYQINSSIDTSKLSTTGDNNVDPLKPYNVSYTKRDDGKGLYVNCNNPEGLSKEELNTSLIKQDVTGKDVFFTFEHNNIPNTLYYYGYRVTNTDNKDIA